MSPRLLSIILIVQSLVLFYAAKLIRELGVFVFWISPYTHEQLNVDSAVMSEAITKLFAGPTYNHLWTFAVDSGGYVLMGIALLSLLVGIWGLVRSFKMPKEASVKLQS